MNHVELLCHTWAAISDCRYINNTIIEELAWRLATIYKCYECSSYRKCYGLDRYYATQTEHIDGSD